MLGSPTCSRRPTARTSSVRDRHPREWFARDARDVAPALIGCALVHGDRAGIIVETEAYLGPSDRASHARFGRTARTSGRFRPARAAYVYLGYGGQRWLHTR